MRRKRREKDTIGKIEYLVAIPIISYFIHAGIQLLLSLIDDYWMIFPYVALGIVVIFCSFLALRLIIKGQKRKEFPQWYYILMLIVSSIELLIGINMFLVMIY